MNLSLKIMMIGFVFLQSISLFTADINLKALQKLEDVLSEQQKNETDEQILTDINTTLQRILKYFTTTSFLEIIEDQLKNNMNLEEVLALENEKEKLLQNIEETVSYIKNVQLYKDLENSIELESVNPELLEPIAPKELKPVDSNNEPAFSPQDIRTLFEQAYSYDLSPVEYANHITDLDYLNGLYHQIEYLLENDSIALEARNTRLNFLYNQKKEFEHRIQSFISNYQLKSNQKARVHANVINPEEIVYQQEKAKIEEPKRADALLSSEADRPKPDLVIHPSAPKWSFFELAKWLDQANSELTPYLTGQKQSDKIHLMLLHFIKMVEDLMKVHENIEELMHHFNKIKNLENQESRLNNLQQEIVRTEDQKKELEASIMASPFYEAIHNPHNFKSKISDTTLLLKKLILLTKKLIVSYKDQYEDMFA